MTKKWIPAFLVKQNIPPTLVAEMTEEEKLHIFIANIVLIKPPIFSYMFILQAFHLVALGRQNKTFVLQIINTLCWSITLLLLQ
jgi:hypothetical protein